MFLVPLREDDLAVGMPLPWSIFDQERVRLFAKGDELESAEQIGLLLACRALRESPSATLAELVHSNAKASKRMVFVRGAGARPSCFGLLSELSEDGARIETYAPLGAIDAVLDLSFEVGIDGKACAVSAMARVSAAHPAGRGIGPDAQMHRYTVVFTDLWEHDRTALRTAVRR